MNERISLKRLYELQPAIPEHIIALQKAANAGLDLSLVYLIKIRASQINNCRFCIKLNTVDALKNGEQQDRIDQLAYWRAANVFSPQERAALAWTETLTLIHPNGVNHSDFAEIREYFSEKEVVDLSVVIIAINSWNRLCMVGNMGH